MSFSRRWTPLGPSRGPTPRQNGRANLSLPASVRYRGPSNWGAVRQFRSVIAKVTDCAMVWYREPGLERDTLVTGFKVSDEKKKSDIITLLL